MQAIKTTKKAPALRLDGLPPDVARRLPLLIGGGVVALGLLFFMLDQPQGATSKNTASRSTVHVAAPAPLPVPRTMKDYSSLMGRNLFKPLVTDQARRTPGAGTAGVKFPNGMTPLPPMSVDGFGNVLTAKTKAITSAWSYIGTVTIDNVSYALLQQSSGGDYGYYRVGEEVGGATIRAIQPETLTLASAGETVRLPKTSGAPPPTVRTSGPNAQNAPTAAPGGNNASAPTPPDNNAQDNNSSDSNNGNGGNNGNFRGGRRGFRGFGGNGGNFNGNFQGFRRRGNGGNFNGGGPNNGDNGNNNGNDNQG